MPTTIKVDINKSDQIYNIKYRTIQNDFDTYK